MNEELELEKLNDLAIHYPVYLIDAAAEHFNGDECKLEANLLNSISYNDATPSLPQAIRLKEFSKAGKLSAEVIEAILGEEKPNQKEKISFKAERLRPYIPSTVPLEKTEDYIIKALEYYQRVQERKKREQAR